jgi:hypothetical protein
MKSYYHATAPENTGSILANGLRPSQDGFVYLADSIENAAKFGFFANDGKEVSIFTVKILKADDSKLEEVYDHNEQFFGCKAYGYNGAIPKERLGAIHRWIYKTNPENLEAKQVQKHD